MFKNTVIVLVGKGGQGKSSTLKFFIDRIRLHFQIHGENLLIDNRDIKTIFNIGGVKIGIESQGDPVLRSIFASKGYSVACRNT